MTRIRSLKYNVRLFVVDRKLSPVEIHMAFRSARFSSSYIKGYDTDIRSEGRFKDSEHDRLAACIVFLFFLIFSEKYTKDDDRVDYL